jgi:SAM-dependent methyltransferase
MKKLNLGCGKNIRKGWTNLDVKKRKGVDIVHDLNKFPYPFNDETFDMILAEHVLEHVDNFPKTMSEIYRILKPRGKLVVYVPYYTSPNAWSHPEHRRAFTYLTFFFFVKGTSVNRAEGHLFDARFQKANVKLIFEGGFGIKRLLGWFFNLFPRAYENSFLNWLFPASKLNAELIK